jgi:ATP-dependent DNA helicase RecG
VEGDVGSGKTVVAAAAIYRCYRSSHQAALMAPTEILAQQHYQSMVKLFQDTGLKIALLTGSVKTAEKKKICLALSEGKIDLLIGTHALIESNAVFRDLALVVIDEQHRFGVNQRNALFMKGNDPDLLVMTATPIPRTLAMTVFAGLDISLLDEMPPGRKSLKTMVITREQEGRAFGFMKKHVAANRQCFIVCPLVEESESLDLEAATDLYERLKHNEMKDIPIGLVHGKMKAAEKDKVLEAFRKNEIAVLIATTVIEVGIDVPNATVMLIRDADRFGLAQLHQIRGRIGRGEAAATCLLEASTNNELALKRLKVLENYSDGFKIAEEDLKLRGPGDFFGIRQHGLPELKLADLFQDHALLVEAAHAVDTLLKKDPRLNADEWQKTKERLGSIYDLGK